MVGDNPPAHQVRPDPQGCAAGRPRAPMPEPDEAQRRAVREALGRLVPLTKRRSSDGSSGNVVRAA